MSEPSSDAIVLTWLSEMQDCVRSVDFARCRAIFATDVRAFGSLGERLEGLDQLEADQWRHVWPRISNFTFDVTRLDSGGTDSVRWLACPWTSIGTRDDGQTFTRPGRITAVLEKRGDFWVAVHTHHSLAE